MRDSEALFDAVRRWPIDEWLEPTPDAHAADGDRAAQEVVLDPYTAWEEHELGDPRPTPRPRIMEALEEIVAAEGPMTATPRVRALQQAAGGRKLTSAARAPLSSALNWLAREGKVALVREADVPWQGDDVARMPDHPEVRVRELGPRELIEVPLDEIAELMRRLRAAHGVGDATGPQARGAERLRPGAADRARRRVPGPGARPRGEPAATPRQRALGYCSVAGWGGRL